MASSVGADVTYVRLKGRFVYVSVLMGVFTRVVRGATEPTFEPLSNFETVGTGIPPKCGRDSSQRSRGAISKCLSLDFQAA